MSRFPLPPGLSPGDIGRTPAEPPPDEGGGGPGEPEQLVSFYWSVELQRPVGNSWVSEYRTVVIDAPITSSLDDIATAAEQEADAMAESGGDYAGFVLVSIELTAPAFYQYFRGF